MNWLLLKKRRQEHSLQPSSPNISAHGHFFTRFGLWIYAISFCLTFCAFASAQTAGSVAAVSVPHVIRFSGTLTAADGNQTVGITFSLYSQQRSGSPLWLETQNVATDPSGNYTVLLGSTTGDGVPADIFSSNEARWLGVKIAGQEEQPRVLLVSVPYAIKAGDAETLGGLPPSAFALNGTTPQTGSSSSSVTHVTETLVSAGPSPDAPSNTATNFTDTTTDQVVDITQNGSGKALLATNNGNNPAIHGINNSTTGSSAYGVWGVSHSTTSGSAGVRGEALGTTNPNIGLWGISFGSGGTGILGEADGPGANYGLRGKSVNSTTGTGLLGDAQATSGNTFGVRARVYSPAGTALQVEAVNALTTGKLFRALNAGTEKMSIDGSGNISSGGVNASGVIQSTSGGFKFPDGSVLTSANNNTNVTTSVSYSGSTTTQIIDAVQNQAGTDDGFNANGVPAGVRGDSTATDGYSAGVLGTANSIFAPGVAGVNLSQCASNDTGDMPICKSYGVFGWSVVASRGVGVWGQADDTTADNVGVYGQASGQRGTGIFGYANNNASGDPDAKYDASGVYGLSDAINGSGVSGYAESTTGNTVGVYGRVAATSGFAGQFDAPTGGNILLGRSGTGSTYNNVFRVDSTGKGFFNGTVQTGGADFAESVDVVGRLSKYEPGDVMMIDSTGSRRLALAKGAYSTKVAGIYSTKPGMLATPHNIDDARVADEMPLAIVGIVPCKVTAENGAIHAGDLLVTASRAGYAMKGTNRRRMLGAVVGKALGSLDKGTGTIEVLVSLH